MVLSSADFAYNSITRRESGSECTGSPITLSNVTLCVFRNYGWSHVEAGDGCVRLGCFPSGRF